ncbi:MAG: FkbM family methyltransferase, partial [Ignavibacteriaceae bacterium]
MKLKNYLPRKIYEPSISFYNRYISKHYQKSYAQQGEDIVLQRILLGIDKGFFVDIGAQHPKRFSNTYFYYKKGWCGINVEPNPSTKRRFDKIRPRDINLEIPISDKEEELTYYMFNDPALNGFSKDISDEVKELKDYRVIGTIKMKTRTLLSILDEYLPIGQRIDFLSIDVEGFDFKVLTSNDWDKYK